MDEPSSKGGPRAGWALAKQRGHRQGCPASFSPTGLHAWALWWWPGPGEGRESVFSSLSISPLRFPR